MRFAPRSILHTRTVRYNTVRYYRCFAFITRAICLQRSFASLAYRSMRSKSSPREFLSVALSLRVSSSSPPSHLCIYAELIGTLTSAQSGIRGIAAHFITRGRSSAPMSAVPCRTTRNANADARLLSARSAPRDRERERKRGGEGEREKIARSLCSRRSPCGGRLVAELRERERERRERKEKERKISPLLDRAASSRRGHAKDRKIDEDCIS